MNSMNNRLQLRAARTVLLIFAFFLFNSAAVRAQFVPPMQDTLYTDASCTAPFDTGTGPTFTSDSTGFTFVYDPDLTGYEPGDPVPAGTTVNATYIVTYPLSGTMDTFSYEIIAADTFPPTFDFIPNDTLLTCLETVPPPFPVTASDDCDSDVDVSLEEITTTNADGSCTDTEFVLTRIWTAADDSGNMTTDSQRITVVNEIIPAYTTPADTIVSCEFSDPQFTGNITAADVMSCGTPTISFTDVETELSCPHNVQIERTWTVSDGCNDSISVQMITLIDTLPPTFTPTAGDTIVSCDLGLNIDVLGKPVDVQDNCSTEGEIDVTKTDFALGNICANTYFFERHWVLTDACGNQDSIVLMITVTDTLAPTVTAAAQDEEFSCATNFEINIAFMNWINANGNAAATDNCTDSDDLVWNAFNSGTSDLANLPAANCPSVQPGIYRQQTVDFVVSDQCGNRDTTTAVFTVTDMTEPVLSGCPTDTLLAAGNDCEVIYDLIPPVIAEGCGSNIGSESHQTTMLIFGQPGPPEDTPVQSVTINFGVSPPPAFAADSATFTIYLGNIDGEDPTEYFNILDENGDLIGQTENTDMQCGESLTALKFGPDQINAWAFDGTITFTLAPNIPPDLPGRFSVNPICPGVSFTTVELFYLTTLPNSLVYEYSVNDGDRINPGGITVVNETFALGENEVKYFVTDCAGNQDSCSFNVIVEDTEVPEFSCPSDVTLTVGDDGCTVDYNLPFPTDISDNCGIGEVSVVSAEPDSPDSLLTFAADPNLGDFLAQNKTFTVNDANANAVEPVEIIITLQADAAGTGAFYTLLDENGNDLLTFAGTDCGTPNQITHIVPFQIYNFWADDGIVTFTAISNTDIAIPPGGPGDGINPCDPAAVTANGDNDGTSFLTLQVRVREVTPTYYAEGATEIPPTQNDGPNFTPTETFNLGTTEMFYILTDVNNNADTCSYFIKVEDNEDPTALCTPSFVTINPSGVVTDTIFPAEIDAGSFDNCGIDTMFTTPGFVTCNSDTVTVTLTVIDESGNQAECQTIVGVANEMPEPTYEVDCEAGILQLFANPPLAIGGAVYTYVWSGPNNFTSFVQNPVVQETDGSDAGFYTVEITGLTGCTAEGVVEVLQSALPPATPDMFVVEDEVCSSDNIVLTASNPPGNGEVNYIWYLENEDGDIQLTVTSSPFYSFSAPDESGTYCYYVITTRNNCFSQPSVTRCVTVTASPSALLQEDAITVCEGEDVVLEAVLPLPGPGVSFEFIGPSGSQIGSAFQYTISNAVVSDGGTYLLTAYLNGCQSNTDTAAVFVNAQPLQPEISSDSPVCIGDTLTLLTNIQGAATYTWTGPDFTEFSTNEPMLQFADADNSLAGNWRVRVASAQGCTSVNSAFTNVTVNPLPSVTASVQNNPTCNNEQVMLFANAIPGAAYEWTGPNGFSAGGSNVSAPPAAGIYTVEVTNQNGCRNTDDTAVVLTDAPVINGVAASDNDCPTGPEDVILKALLADNTMDYTFNWTGENFISADSCAVIENATTDNNGSYQVIVTGENGCADTSFVQVNMGQIINTPQPPVSAAGTDLCAGDALTLTTSADLPGTDVTWYWITPTGTIPTSTSSLVIDPVSVANTGEYMVYARVNDCFSDTSGVLLLTVSPTPVTTAECLNCPVCEGDDIILSADCGIPGATYEWTSTTNFNSTLCSPMIPNADEALHEGTYSVRVRVNGCWSEPASVFVGVNPRPNNPQATATGPFCVSTAPITLTVNTGTATPGATYRWFRIESGGTATEVGSTVSTSFSVPDSETYADGNYTFYVVAEINDCLSAPSPEIIVAVNTVPNNQAYAGEDLQVCEEDEINLNADAPTVGTGIWTALPGNPAGAEITNPDEALTSVTGLIPGNTYRYEWSLSNGACADYSTDTTEIVVSLVELADAGELIEVCSVTEVNLDAVQPTFGDGVWTQPEVQEVLGVMIVEPNNPNTLVTGLVPGNTYIFTWTIPDNGCGEDSEDVLVQVADDTANAGQDDSECGFGCVTLSALAPQVGQGEWFSVLPGVSFADRNDPNTEVCGLDNGENTFIWILNNGACGEAGTDSVTINYQLAPNANDDLFTVAFAGVEELNLLENDEFTGDFFVNILTEPQNGIVAAEGQGIFTYTAGINFVGTDFFTYELCAPSCECTEAVVRLSVGGEVECDIPTIFTPNGDNVNDAFVIPCLAQEDKYPNNVVSVFNQWGDEVFRAAPYENNWRGTYNGEDLPTGTYYFIVDLGNGDKPNTGFLVLNR